MSDIKNVLKAGFLLTASLLATGCGDKADTAETSPNTPNVPGNDVPAQSKSTVSSYKFNLGAISKSLSDSLTSATLPKMPAAGFADNYDVFSNATTSVAAPTQLASTALVAKVATLASAQFAFMGYNQQGKSYKFDTSVFKDVKAGENHLGALLIDGKIDEAAKKRVTFFGTVVGALRVDAVILRNAVLTAFDSAAASLTSAYTYVGVDAALGYDFIREGRDGKAIDVSYDIHAQLDPVVAKLAGNVPAAGTDKPITAGTSSKATNTDDVSAAEKKNEAKETVVTAPKDSTKGRGKFTLHTKAPGVAKEMLDKAGLNVAANKGALDIAGRISAVNAKDVIITAVGSVQPELVLAPAVAKTAATKKTVAATAETAAAAKAAKAAADKNIADLTAAKTAADKLVDDKQTAANTAATAKTAAETVVTKAGKGVTAAQTKAAADKLAAAQAADKALADAKTAQTKAAKLLADAKQPAATKATTTAATVAADSSATADKTSAGQSVVKTATGHKFLFEVKPGGNYAEIGELTVNDTVEYHVISDHALFVHKLIMNKDLGLRVLAQQHTFDKLTEANLINFKADGDKIANGQAMMEILKKEQHSVQTSTVAEETAGATDKPYVHYDSLTKFPLWVAATTGTGKLALSGIDLDPGVTLDAGVYALPLVKDMSNKLSNNSGNTAITLANGAKVTEWKIISNGYFDQVLLISVDASSAKPLSATIMASAAQAGRSAESSVLAGLVSTLDPTNLVSGSFASLSSSRANQAAQVASLARGVSAASSEKLGAVETHSVTFNHAGTQFGLTYNLDGGNAFSSSTGTTSFGANVASDVLGLKAIASVEASVDAGKNAYASSSLASYNAGLTFAKAYSLGGLSVVPMGGFGVSSNALNSYSAVVPMAAGALGLSMNDVSFSAATFHAGVSVALDEFAAVTTGVNASLTLGVAGYLASTANATLSTSEGKSADLQFAGSAVTPYAQFNLGFASGEKLNTMISSGIVAVNFGLDR